MRYILRAKTRPKEETIREHTENIIKEYNKLKKIYPNIKYLNWDILRLACLYHDLGKANTKFQNRLGANFKDELINIDEVYHNYLSPAFLPMEKLKRKYDEDDLRILYQSIYYHHDREELENTRDLKVIIKEDLVKYRHLLNIDEIDMEEELYHDYIQYTTIDRIPAISDKNKEEVVLKYFITKGLLNKLDYASSAHIDVEIENKDLQEKTLGFLTNKYNGPNKLQEYMLKNQDKNNIIIASTGAGKTEASLLWIGNNKGFFSLPLRVSINSIYDRMIDKINFKDTALLHSETYSEYSKRNNDNVDLDYYNRTKQISMPLTITTLDQFVDFVFKYEGFEIKLATLSYTKLIIDEIQMYSPEMIGYLIVALKYITKVGGKFSIVTATLPSIFLNFLDEQGVEYNKPYVYTTDLLRHRIKVYKKCIGIQEILNNYKNKNVLVIVNTVKKAQELYDELKNELKDTEVKINLFHSRFIRRDRREKEDLILEIGDTNSNEKGIWITTQVVEASLDIDFDVLYTELSDVTGLMQRMGRVYRNRQLDHYGYNVYVYVGGENERTSGVGRNENSIVDPTIFDLSKEVIIQYDGRELYEKDKLKIIDNIYTKEKLDGTDYYDKIKNTIKEVEDIKEYVFEKSRLNLRKIYNESVIPLNVYNEFKKEIDDILLILNSRDVNWKQKQKAKDYIKEFIVDIPTYEFERARKNGRYSHSFKLDKYTCIFVIDYEYTFEKGLVKPKSEIKFNEKLQIL